MKKLLFSFLFCCVAFLVNAQQYVECVYLKNGSIIKGTIVEQIPNETLKIKTADGSLFVYSFADVVKITKEVISTPVNNYSRARAGLQVTRHNDLLFNGKKVSNSERLQMLGADRFKTFNSACRQVRTGRSFLVVGFIMTGITLALSIASAEVEYEEDSDYYRSAAIISGAVADVGLCLGFIFKGIGKGRRNWVVQDYNMNHSVSFTNNIGSSNLYFAPSVVRTPNLPLNNQFAYGAKVCLNF